MALFRRVFLCHLFAAIAGAGAPAIAQEPPLKLIVGIAPGAGSDIVARLLGERMAKTLKRPVIVENKPGAAGRIGNELVKAAPPDGSTLLFTPVATMAIFPHSYAGQLRYDPFKDFTPVSHVANFVLGLAVSAQTPVQTLADYVAWVKADPGKHGFFASPAAGSIPHFFGAMFGREAGIDLTHVPYKGTAPALQALLAGDVGAVLTVTADIKPLVAAGKVRLLAVGGETRDRAFPKVQTFKELGYDLAASPWYALFAPAGTPSAVVDKLARAAADAVREPALNKQLTEMGFEPTGYGPKRLAEVLKADFEFWKEPIRISGYKPGD